MTVSTKECGREEERSSIMSVFFVESVLWEDWSLFVGFSVKHCSLRVKHGLPHHSSTKEVAEWKVLNKRGDSCDAKTATAPHTLRLH